MVSEISSSLPFIEGRGGVTCRGCLGGSLFSGLDLGQLPIANELLRSKEELGKISTSLKNLSGLWPGPSRRCCNSRKNF